MNMFLRAKKLFAGRHARMDDDALKAGFRRKYSSFKALLESNAELLKIIGDLEEKQRGEQIFGLAALRSATTRAIFHAMRMAKSLDEMSIDSGGQGRFGAVIRRADELRGLLQERLGDLAAAQPERPAAAQSPQSLLFNLKDLDRHMVDQVGGKAANLGELAHAGTPVPEGFAVGVDACDLLLDAETRAEIDALLETVDAEDPAQIQECSEAIQAIVLKRKTPESLAAALLRAFDDLAARVGADPASLLVAVRSSAVGEDGALSFAGQHVSALGVRREKLPDAWRLVVASLFTPRAISYRLRHGVPFEAARMGVVCLEMVDAVCSGVAFGRPPDDMLADETLVNAVWGLGNACVDGLVEPDSYRTLRRDAASAGPDFDPAAHVRHSTGDKRRLFRLTPDGPREEMTQENLRLARCLTDAEASLISDWAQTLENRFGAVQDIEWAKARDGRFLALQSRPLTAMSRASCRLPQPAQSGEDKQPALIDGADVAHPGVGSGPAYLTASRDDLGGFPQGGVLVAKHSSPQYVLVMHKAAAIIAERGSVTGHMASLAREYDVPTILNAKDAMSRIAPGDPITVDAYSGRVLRGLAERQSERKRRAGVMRDSPVFSALRGLAELITPLRLTNPKSPDFRAESCESLHDLARFIHENSYQVMFCLSDGTSDASGCASRLDASVPLDLRVIDLGGGLRNPADKDVSPEEVLSIPLKALLEGMLDPALRHAEPRPINVKGFLSVMGEQFFTPAHGGAERFGDRSYAIISDKYLNFSSRIGYHYSVLDAWCGKTINKNYVRFAFKGGAAEEVRRQRRARSIGLILESLGFRVEVQGDRMDAAYEKFDQDEIKQRIVDIGRLLIFTRQMDMLMVDEASVQNVANRFLAGNYVHDAT